MTYLSVKVFFYFNGLLFLRCFVLANFNAYDSEDWNSLDEKQKRKGSQSVVIQRLGIRYKDTLRKENETVA